MAEIALEKLTKVYGDGTRAVSELDLEVADGEFVVFVARVDRETRAREGGEIELVVDPKRLHFFAIETGLGIYDGEK